MRIVVLLAMLVASAAASAQNYPTRPIRMIIPYSATGLPDLLARTVAEAISKPLGQQVVVDNRPGAAGIIAAGAAAKAEADGYTLALVDNNTHGINPAVFPKLPYDPMRDFAPVTQAIRGPMYLVAHGGANVGSVKELIELAKAKPGLNYGSPGNATLHHLGMEELSLVAGVKMTHIPYKGVVQAVPALLTGDVTSMFTSLGPVASHAKAGKLRILAVGSRERSPITPDVPTVAESGYPGFEVDTTMGFAVPAGTPAPIIQRLNQVIVAALRSPEVDSKIGRLGVEVVANTPSEYEAQMLKDIARYRDIVRRTGLKVE